MAVYGSAGLLDRAQEGQASLTRLLAASVASGAKRLVSVVDGQSALCCLTTHSFFSVNNGHCHRWPVNLRPEISDRVQASSHFILRARENRAIAVRYDKIKQWLDGASDGRFQSTHRCRTDLASQYMSKREPFSHRVKDLRNPSHGNDPASTKPATILHLRALQHLLRKGHTHALDLRVTWVCQVRRRNPEAAGCEAYSVTNEADVLGLADPVVRNRLEHDCQSRGAGGCLATGSIDVAGEIGLVARVADEEDALDCVKVGAGELGQGVHGSGGSLRVALEEEAVRRVRAERVLDLVDDLLRRRWTV